MCGLANIPKLGRYDELTHRLAVLLEVRPTPGKSMKISLSVAILGLSWVSACASSPSRPVHIAGPLAQQMDADDVDGDGDVDKPQASVVPDKRVTPANLPAQELSAKILYQMLLAEIAAQRGRINVAVTTYLEVAKATRDPRIAQRATELAMYGRLAPQALEASTIWAETDPQSQQARQIMTSLLLASGKLDQARPHLEKFLAGDEKEVRQSFLGLNNLLARHPDKEGTLKMVRELADPFPQMPEAHYAVSMAALNAKQVDVALAEARRALELKPDWEGAAQLQGQILQQSNKEGAIKFYQEFLEKNPKASDLRLSFARFLADQKDYKGARGQFNELEKVAPNNPDIIMAIGLLSLQLQDYEAAEGYFSRALGLSPRDPDGIRMYLGQVNEDRKRYDKAGEWYKQVGPGEQYLNGQIKYANMLARQGKLDEARAHLQGVKAEGNQQKIQITLADASLLREAKKYDESYRLLGEALEKNPDAPDLLYDHAMAAEKLDKLDVLERDLRKLIELKPDHAHAYNALGYTLADRTTRLPEALELIKKAVELAPEDAFILDSLGWVHYRLGNMDESLTHLRRAFEIRPDPEIAAHLGEVLWVKGSQAEASKLWRAAYAEHPDNEVLASIMKKYKQ